eukprot:TRINITY_DN9046_c0_g1_i1.p1 TRINITY_DN9046_c0_g1~~TRINITY_DN9046_c0_g1_i1.p1  ORF type:complete len:624 (+),score=129.03 TRINITY_DN9046_c0_g1_i1:706-2577(+)
MSNDAPSRKWEHVNLKNPCFSFTTFLSPAGRLEISLENNATQGNGRKISVSSKWTRELIEYAEKQEEREAAQAEQMVLESKLHQEATKRMRTRYNALHLDNSPPRVSSCEPRIGRDDKRDLVLLASTRETAGFIESYEQRKEETFQQAKDKELKLLNSLNDRASALHKAQTDRIRESIHTRQQNVNNNLMHKTQLKQLERQKLQLVIKKDRAATRHYQELTVEQQALNQQHKEETERHAQEVLTRKLLVDSAINEWENDVNSFVTNKGDLAGTAAKKEILSRQDHLNDVINSHVTKQKLTLEQIEAEKEERIAQLLQKYNSRQALAEKAQLQATTEQQQKANQIAKHQEAVLKNAKHLETAQSELLQSLVDNQQAKLHRAQFLAQECLQEQCKRVANQLSTERERFISKQAELEAERIKQAEKISNEALTKRDSPTPNVMLTGGSRLLEVLDQMAQREIELDQKLLQRDMLVQSRLSDYTGQRDKGFQEKEKRWQCCVRRAQERHAATEEAEFIRAREAMRHRQTRLMEISKSREVQTKRAQELAEARAEEARRRVQEVEMRRAEEADRVNQILRQQMDRFEQRRTAAQDAERQKQSILPTVPPSRMSPIASPSSRVENDTLE